MNDYESRFFEMSDKEVDALDRFANVSETFTRDIKQWESSELRWGLIGNGHDTQHALEMIVKAKDEEEALVAAEEYVSCKRTYKGYLKEIKRRMKKSEKGGS